MHQWWECYYIEEFVQQIQVVGDVVAKRFLPAFDNLEEEATKIEQAAYNDLSDSAGPVSDPAALAERAFQAGLVHYQNLTHLQQGLLNVLAAFCYHLFEQQLFYFHRKELLKQSEENDRDLLKHKEVKKRLAAHGIDIEGFRSWPKIDELRLVANVVKHADGESAEGLKRLRPEMFRHPELRDHEHLKWLVEEPGPVFQPLFGNDFYVTTEDLKSYVEAVVDFWNEMASKLKQQEQ